MPKSRTAALSAMVRFFIEARTWDSVSPAEVLAQTAALLRHRLPSASFVSAFMGEVNRDLNGRRGRVLGMDSHDGFQIISANVPQSELFSYATELRSLTGGRGTFTATLDRYDELPSHLAEKVVAAHRKDAESTSGH